MKGEIEHSLITKSFVILLALSFLPSMDLMAEVVSARSIMEKVEGRDDGNNSVIDLTMTLVDKKGKKRIRVMRSYSRDQGADEFGTMYFLKPADVKDTAFLNQSYGDKKKGDEQYLYLPALHKVKRIAGSDKTDSFMGSDLTYADMGHIDLDDFSFEILKEVYVRDEHVWVIRALPIDDSTINETGYIESIFFVQKNNYVVVRAIRKLKGGKKIKYTDVKALEKIDGIWTPTETHIFMKKGKKVVHQTILKNTSVKYNQEIDADLFKVNSFYRGL